LFFGGRSLQEQERRVLYSLLFLQCCTTAN